MKLNTLLWAVIASVFFASCTQLWFVQPLPQQASNESEFPAWAIGTFASPKQVDTLAITAHEYALVNKSSTSGISDTLAVRWFKNYLVVNQKLGAHWQPVFLKPHKDGSFSMYAFDVSTEKKMKRLQRKTTLVSDETGKENIFLANPNDRELAKMMRSRSFISFGNFHRVRP